MKTLIAMTTATFALCSVCSTAVGQQAGSWSGAYGTVFGQYTGGTSSQNDNGFVYTPPGAPIAAAPPVVVPPPVLVVANGSYGLSGGFGGGGVGYNLQTGRIVYGIVLNFAGGRATGSSNACGTPAHACGTSISAMADVRGRIGYALGKALLFGTGGLSIDNLHAYDSLFGRSGSAWQAGWVVGGGVEYRIAPRWTVAAEYLHADIESAHLFDIVPGTPERIAARSDTARVSLNYYFNGAASEPLDARY